MLPLISPIEKVAAIAFEIPDVPAVPAAPASPGAPDAPVVPVKPVEPVEPVGPLGPILPAVPDAPVAPTAPVAPVAPGVPPPEPEDPAAPQAGHECTQQNYGAWCLLTLKGWSEASAENSPLNLNKQQNSQSLCQAVADMTRVSVSIILCKPSPLPSQSHMKKFNLMWSVSWVLSKNNRKIHAGTE